MVQDWIQNCRESITRHAPLLTLTVAIIIGIKWLIGAHPENPTLWGFVEEASRTWVIALVLMILWRLILQAAGKWLNSRNSTQEAPGPDTGHLGKRRKSP